MRRVADGGVTARQRAASPTAVGIGVATALVGLFAPPSAGQTSGSAPREIAQLTASEGQPFDHFGSSIGVDGDIMVIGAPRHDGAATNAGAVYVFERDPLDPTAWTETSILIASDAGIEDHFGACLGIADETLLIGAPTADRVGTDSGAAYVFERDPLDPTAWIEIAQLLPSDAAAGDQFGSSLSISGDTLLIGARESNAQMGAAYVFERDPLDPSSWIETAKLTAGNGVPGDYFAHSVWIDGDTVIIGAMWADRAVPKAGTAYVFERDPLDPTQWLETAELTPSNGKANDGFGIVVTLDGDTAAIGAHKDDQAAENAGAIYVFERDPLDPSQWLERAKLTASDALPDDRFGAALAIDSDRIIGGAKHEGHAGTDSGAAYFFERRPGKSSTWREIAKLVASDPAPGEEFGENVSLGETELLVGARFDDLTGSVYVFEEDPPLGMTVTGSCPGSVDVTVSGAPPLTEIGLIAAANANGFTLGKGTCSGTVLEVGEPFRLPLTVVLADGLGVATTSMELATGQCWLEAIDFADCATSPAANTAP